MQANTIHADFTGVDSLVCPTNSDPRNPSTYTDASTGFVAHHQWLLPASLGPSNPNPGDVPSITEQYANAGCDRIGMVAIDQFYACRDTVWKNFCVVNPTADYTLVNLADTFHACPPAAVCFRDSSRNGACTFGWNFGNNGPIDTARNACHLYTVPGTYSVKHYAISCHGCVDSTTKYTIKIGGPYVSMTSSVRGGCPCLPISYYITTYNADTLEFSVGGSGVTDVNGVPIAFQDIAIPRGTPANPTLDTLTYIYCGVGDIHPIILAKSNGCYVQYDSLVPAIPVDTPTVDFFSNVFPCGADSVCFTKLTTYSAHSAHDSTYLWSFGDGTTSTLANPCHRYAAPGDYVVTLHVMDNTGCSNSHLATQSVHVPAAPHAIFMVDDSFGCSPFAVHFKDSSTVDNSTTIASGYWNFGDGTPVANTWLDTSHLYNGTGTFTATLVITDGLGCTDSAHHSIQVQGPPTITVGPTPNPTICLGDTVALTGSGSSALNWLTHYNIDDTLSANPRVWPRNDTTYILQVGTLPRCYVYDSVHVYVSKVTILTDTAVLVCKGNATAFSATAQTTHSSIVSSGYYWNFGDATSAIGQNTTHVYANIGSYTDSLIVTNALGCKDTALRPVVIFDKPHAAFTLSLDSICPNGNIDVTNTSTAGTSAALSTFTFNDPPLASFSTSTATISYPTAGTNIITLIQTDLNQCADTTSQTVYVLPLPATYKIDTTICPGDTITLRAIGSNTVLWNPNYNIDNAASVTPRVWPSVNTQYIAQVGPLPTCYVYDTVNVIMSTISITLDTALPACSNQASNFKGAATAVNATVTSFNWHYGDNNSGSGANTSHQFATFGTYNDYLIVTSSRGCKDTAYFTNIVYDIPNAALSISIDSVCLGAPVTVNNLSTAGTSAALSTFYFDMEPNGSPDITASPGTYTYTAAGSYIINLVQSDLNGCVDTARMLFVVHALPVANFTADDTSCINVNNQYVSTSTIGDGPIQSYSWTINGTALGVDSSIINYTFNTPSNTDNICLTVQDNFGCTGNICKIIDIVDKPVVSINNMDPTICAGFTDTVSVTGNVDRVQWVPSVWVDNPTSTNVIITPRQTIDYQVIIYYKNCVPLIDTVPIWVIDSVPVSASADPENIILGLSSNVTSVVKGTIDSIVWDPDSTLNCRNCRNPVATPQHTMTYNATVYYSKNGVVCSNRTSVTIAVYQSCDNSLIYVPNTFTPNGDGRNEVFRLRGQGITKVNYFRVYDRWGKLVYEATNADDADSAAWNGGLHNETGKPVNSGVFVYVFEIQCITGQTVSGKGNVTLIR
jgi:gliding motility-associated-like protein